MRSTDGLRQHLINTVITWIGPAAALSNLLIMHDLPHE